MNIIISDFDFTLLEHGASPDIFKENLRAIDQWRDAGNSFAIATGRGEESLHDVFPECNRYCDYFVLCDGAIVTDNTGELLYADRFGETLAKQLTSTIAAIDYRQDYALIAFGNKKEFPIIEADTCKVRFWFDDVNDCLLIERILADVFSKSISFIGYHDIKFNDDTPRLPWVSPSMRHIIEVTRADVDKSTGVQKLLSTINVDNLDRVTTIGDGKNDLCMIKTFDGFAVENADPAILAHISDSHRVPHFYNLVANRLSH